MPQWSCLKPDLLYTDALMENAQETNSEIACHMFVSWYPLLPPPKKADHTGYRALWWLTKGHFKGVFTLLHGNGKMQQQTEK